MPKFPNKAGDHADTDDILTAELQAAGIPTLDEIAQKETGRGLSPSFKNMLRNDNREVKSSVRGALHGWTFLRAWEYWVAEGPGIPVEAAEELHRTHGKEARVDGDAGCPSPRAVFHGLGCGMYHIDTPEGLKALADTIKVVVKRSDRQEAKSSVVERGFQSFLDAYQSRHLTSARIGLTLTEADRAKNVLLDMMPNGMLVSGPASIFPASLVFCGVLDTELCTEAQALREIFNVDSLHHVPATRIVSGS